MLDKRGHSDLLHYVLYRLSFIGPFWTGMVNLHYLSMDICWKALVFSSFCRLILAVDLRIAAAFSVRYLTYLSRKESLLPAIQLDCYLNFPFLLFSFPRTICVQLACSWLELHAAKAVKSYLSIKKVLFFCERQYSSWWLGWRFQNERGKYKQLLLERRNVQVDYINQEWVVVRII